MSDFILEIGTEEIPARFLDQTQEELISRFTSALKEEGLGFLEMQSFATPRRATLYIKDLENQQELKEETFVGPAKKIAYQEDGTLSKAAQGFARGHKVEEKDIFVLETEKGEYIAVKKQVGGKKAAEILSEISPQIILSLPFAKRMRWNSFTLAYARPIHWIVALLDEEVLAFSVGEIKSSNTTCGHRIHGKKNVEIKNTKSYFDVIKNQAIMINSDDRKAYIIEKGNEIASAHKAKIIWKEDLLNEVKGLVECPVPLLGEFDSSFLELPKEVLLTSMESHQKSFGLESENNELLPYFLTVANLNPLDVNIVKKGWERVLRARLEDARFFWKTDTALLEEKGFEAWLLKLDKVIFLGPLGSMGDKSRRLEKLMLALAEKLQFNKVLAAEAGRMAKADLVSAMVGEFDTLQGVMGGIYAQKLGKKDLADAVSSHYLPLGPETSVPENDYAALLSLCDKADTLVGLFGLNSVPTGTADPYALRRNAISIARILRDKAWALDVEEIFELAYSFYDSNIKWKLSKDEALEKIIEFYNARVKNLFLTEGNDPLFVDAILSTLSKSSMSEKAKKLEALKDFASHSAYIPTVQSYKRITNIIRKQAANYTLSDKLSDIKQELFENNEEKKFFTEIGSYYDSFGKAYQAQDYAKCFELLTEISPFIDEFFDKTMVMAEDETVRINRLILLNITLKPLLPLADFSALQI